MLMQVAFVLLSLVVNLSSACCDNKQCMTLVIEAAVDLISEVKSENNSRPVEHDSINVRALDCADLYKRGYNISGVYTIWPINRLTRWKPMDVYCDMDTEGGGWTVIQRRGDFGRADDYFNQDWKTYANGFGDIKKDFWLGNNNMFALTNQKLYSVRFELEDNEGNKRFTQYDSFWIDDEINKYAVHFSGRSGNGGDSLADHNNMKFTARDQDNDLWNQGNCGEKYKSGWWFKNCLAANLNGLYNNQTHGIYWSAYRAISLSSLPSRIEIKIRPSTF